MPHARPVGDMSVLVADHSEGEHDEALHQELFQLQAPLRRHSPQSHADAVVPGVHADVQGIQDRLRGDADRFVSGRAADDEGVFNPIFSLTLQSERGRP